MAYDTPGRTQRESSDSRQRQSSPSKKMQVDEEPYELHEESRSYMPPPDAPAYEGARRAARLPTEPQKRLQSYLPPSRPDEPIEERRAVRRLSGFQDSRGGYIKPSLHGEDQGVPRPPRMPSPPSEALLPQSIEQQQPSQPVISDVSPELIEHLTRLIKKEIFDELKQDGSVEAKSEEPETENLSTPGAVDNVESTDEKSSTAPSPTMSTRRTYTPPSPGMGPRRATVSDDSPPQSPISPPGSPSKEKPAVRFTNPRGSVDKDGAKSARPAAYRSFSNAELSAVDQKWGKLFENDRAPTARLGQFLRGLANYLIEEVEPKNSIVVTPEKMASLYTNFALKEEAHPLLVSIFRSRSHDSISTLYQILRCQHHLVQDEPNQLPTVPGLTPAGFSQWLATWILAYPDQETVRLQKMLESLPINADGQPVDGKPERLPKQISRHLLPTREDPNVRAALSKEIKDFLDDLEISKKPKPQNASPLFQERISVQGRTRPLDIPPKTLPRGADRDAALQGNTPPEASCFEDGVPIERTRQPYVAQPGNGKVYVDSLNLPSSNRSGRANSIGRSSRDEEPEPKIKHARTQSNASSNPPPRPGGSRRGPSPPLNKNSRSNPTSLDTSGVFVSDPFALQAQSYSASSYIPPSRLPGPGSNDSRERDRDREKDRDRKNERDRERDRDHERERDRDRPRRERSRRSTIGNETSRPLIDIPKARDVDRYNRAYDDRDRDRDRDGRPPPIVHQESRADHRASLPLPSAVLDEDWYRGAGGVRSDRNGSGGDYETDRVKYNTRRL